MKLKFFMPIIAVSLSLGACGQSQNGHSPQVKKNKTEQKMDLLKITNEKVRQAIEALQSGDKSWYTFFTENPAMTDDGNKTDFRNFFSKALGNEKFITIDKVENNGRDIYGNFKAGQWGTFKVFFKFHQNDDGKFDRLDIGQARY